MRRLPRIALPLCLLLFLTARPVAATLCLPATAAEMVAGAHTIVIGRVTAVDDSVLIRSGNTIRMPEQGVPHTLAVERVYKGEAGPELTVYQRWIIGAPNLHLGDRWLLFLHVDDFGHLTAGPCTPSTRLAPGAEPAPELAAVLGPGKAPAGSLRGRQHPTAWPAGWVGAVLAGAMGAVLAGAGLYLRRRRGGHR